MESEIRLFDRHRLVIWIGLGLIALFLLIIQFGLLKLPGDAFQLFINLTLIFFAFIATCMAFYVSTNVDLDKPAKGFWIICALSLLFLFFGEFLNFLLGLTGQLEDKIFGYHGAAWLIGRIGLAIAFIVAIPGFSPEFKPKVKSLGISLGSFIAFALFATFVILLPITNYPNAFTEFLGPIINVSADLVALLVLAVFLSMPGLKDNKTPIPVFWPALGMVLYLAVDVIYYVSFIYPKFSFVFLEMGFYCGYAFTVMGALYKMEPELPPENSD